MGVGFRIVEAYRFLELLNGAVVLFILRKADSEIEMRDADTQVDGQRLVEPRPRLLKVVAADQDVGRQAPASALAGSWSRSRRNSRSASSSFCWDQ